ncbi:MAG: zf-HC2 domain-containing protein [Nitrososphaerales archaeon]
MTGQHTDFTVLMSLVLDDEATEAEARALREHLAGCDACARTWQRWQELDRRLAVAPMAPAPVDFSVAVAARLDQRMAEEQRRRWFMLGLALSSIASMAVAVLALGLVTGWPIQLLPQSGPVSAGLEGVLSIGGWLFRVLASFVERMGTPTVAAGAGALLCVTCALATVWLWMVARLSPAGDRQFVSAD